MTNAQLADIEQALGIPLPLSYKALMTSDLGRISDRNYAFWLYQDPSRVIDANMTLCSSLEGVHNWTTNYFTIGHDGGGNQYFLDLANIKSPVFCLDHETKEITTEWSSLDEFVIAWREKVQQLVAQSKIQKSRWWQFWR
jgi:hypothetical protein